MGKLSELGSGIFIDLQCKGIQQFDLGYFVPLYPDGIIFGQENQDYHKDLQDFLRRWFPDTTLEYFDKKESDGSTEGSTSDSDQSQDS